MSSENYTVKLNSEFIEKFYGLVNSSPPSEVTIDDLHEVLKQISIKLNPEKDTKQTNVVPDNATDEQSDKAAPARPKTVLVVDDLGIITFQLEILFKKIGFEVVISKEINDAIEKYKTQDFGYTVIDLFIPTEREGFILLDEIKKLSLLCGLNTKIIVMTASSKPEYKINCKNHGADYYLEKAAGWQKELMEACLND